MEKVHILGLMAEFMMEIGNRIKCMEEEYLPGLMVENMKVNTMMIRNKDMEYSLGQMDESGVVSGRIISLLAVSSFLVNKKVYHVV